MWGFDVPDADEDGQDEPFGFASKGGSEEASGNPAPRASGGVR